MAASKRVWNALLVASVAVTLLLFALVRAAEPVTLPGDGEVVRVLRWTYGDASSISHWEWQEVGETIWTEIDGDTMRGGVWYGLAFLPPGFVEIYVRAVTADGNVSVPSNPIQIPNCWDADNNRDGGVGGPDFLLLMQFSGACEATGL